MEPHPLSRITTELVWEGKYDDFGNRRELNIIGATLPLQKIETIDEPRSRAEASNDAPTLFELDQRAAKLGDFRNRLIWGDNKLVLASLLQEFRGAVRLIYIDPPFDVGADFSMRVPLGDDSEIEKQQSTLELVAYRDMWGRGADSFLEMLYERLVLMRELLTDDGSIYLHCDWRMAHYIRCLLDDVFGASNFRSSIVWAYGRSARGAKAIASQFARNHDDILCYSKSSQVTFNGDTLYRKYTIDEAKKVGFRQDDEGRWFKTAPRGDYTDDSIARLRQEGRIWETRNGNIRIKYVLEQNGPYVIEPVPVGDVWLDIPDAMHLSDAELTGFATQKPEALLNRIVKAATNEGDLVADFFCGSGTATAAAERHGRRWIGCDLGRFAIHTSYKRMIDVQRERNASGLPYRAFDVFNLGRYERQWWQHEHLRGADEEHRRVVLQFFRAESLSSAPSPLIHARKGTALVHVAAIDSVFSRTDLDAVARAASSAGALAVDCLAWEFEMDLKLEERKLETELGVAIRLLYIPREIMERNRDEVTFFEVAALEAVPVIKKALGETVVDIKLVKFLPSLSEVPVNELIAMQDRARKNGFDFIDFWAVCFDYSYAMPFRHDWQAFRTMKERDLPRVSTQNYKYKEKGSYLACVKVVDTFGCDTSITVPVELL